MRSDRFRAELSDFGLIWFSCLQRESIDSLKGMVILIRLFLIQNFLVSLVQISLFLTTFLVGLLLLVNKK